MPNQNDPSDDEDLKQYASGKRQRPDENDEEFKLAYRTLLIGQYQTLDKMSDNSAAKQEAESILKIPPCEVKWEDLYRLELAIVKLAPEPLLRRQAWILRNEYEEIASADEFKDYMASNPPKADGPDKADIEELRADLVQLQEELNWRYLVIWVLESVRGQLIKALLMWELSSVIVFLVISQIVPIANWLNSFFPLNLPLLGFIVTAGLMGGLTSTLQRIQSIQFNRNADLDMSELLKSNLGIYISPLLGGVFAMLLYFLFAGQLLAGDLFPKVSIDTLFTYPPTEDFTSGDLGKLVVWSFIAGFAERFVPDKLQRLVSTASDDNKK